MHFVTEIPIGPKQAKTLHGYLICRDVPIARTGQMLYDARELQGEFDPSPDGLIRIERPDEEVFSPATISSFEHNAITIDHPEEFVMPTNWRGLAVGIAQNVRRGADNETDLLLADFLITDQAAIDLIRGGQRQVSCGYDADYEQTSPGRGIQRNIRGNHVALVERGRCGSRCAIGDKESTPVAKRTPWDKIMTAFRAKDEEAITEAIAEAKEDAKEDGTTQRVEIVVSPSGKVEAEHTGEATEDRKGTADAAIAAITDRVAGLESKLDRFMDSMTKAKDEKSAEEKEAEERAAKKKKEEEEEDDKKTKDSGAAIADWQDTVARAEILAPGIHLPTRDAAFTQQKANDTLCALRRASLTSAYARTEGKAVIDAILGGRTADFKALTCDAAAMLFNGASEAVKAENNRGRMPARDGDSHTPIKSIADINSRHRDFWAKR